MKTGALRRFLPLLIACFLMTNLPLRAEPSGDVEALVVSAERAYQEGVEALNGSSVARAAFERSADLWRRSIREGADGPAGWFNLGNALLRAGRVGDAIVAYRRAEMLSPSSDDIAANLAEARRRVDRPIEADATDLNFSDLSSWWDPISTGGRVLIGIVAWFVFWGLVYLRTGVASETRRAEREGVTAAWRSGIAGSLAITIFAGATVAVDLLLPRWRAVAVVTSGEAALRSGNGDAFEVLTTEPLSEGVEFVILEERPGWWRIRLPDDTQGWISREDARSVDPD